ncbi:hypothetical protein [Halovivax limisalsi]|uniref:hypothetical protein n=1 Tax=Halovivax limisalsi TaxID=1453760 RepID=UPI001FFD2286|nr:hypothetical protein [Halovivax limisalsi]
MKDEPNWAVILDTIYRNNVTWPSDTNFDKDHPVVSAVNLDAETVQENLAMLSQSGLVGKTHVGMKADIPRPGKEGLKGITGEARRQGTHVGLTARGFHVAHEREVMEQEQKEQDRRIQSQNEINSAIGFLTLGLLFVNFVDTWITVTLDTEIANWSTELWLAVMADAVVVAGIGLLLQRTGLLEPYSIMSDQN